VSDHKDNSLTSKKKFYTDPSFLLLWVMVFVYPLFVVPGPLIYFFGPRYLMLTAVSILAFYHAIRLKVKLERNILITILVFLLTVLISSLMAPDLNTAFFGSFSRYTGFSTYLFCVLLFILATSNNQPLVILKYIIVSAAVVSFIALLQFYGVDILFYEMYKGSDNRAFSTMGNANWLGFYTAFILPGSMILYLVEKKRCWLFSTLLIYAGLLSNTSRGSWLTFATAFIFILISFWRDKEKRQKLLLVVVLFAIITLFMLPVDDWLVFRFAVSTPVQVTSAVQLEESAGSGRMFIWKSAFDIFRDNLLFGVGPDHLYIIRLDGKTIPYAHNIFLEKAASMGLFVLLSYFLFVFVLLKRAWNSTYYRVFFVMLTTYLVHGLFNSEVIAFMPLFWVTAGLAIAFARKSEVNGVACENIPETEENKEKLKLKRHLFMVTIIGLLIFVLGFSYIYFYPSYRTVVVQGSSGGTYTGQFRGISYHGQGTWEANTGITYTGSFRYGEFAGFGEMLFPNGSRYCGEFKNGRFHGQGKIIAKDGSVTEGIFKHGRLIKSGH